ncbi:MAG: peptide ABC transporter substrate-binding protein [bacterium]
MQERIARLIPALRASRSFGLLDRLRARVEELSPGDAAILGALGVLLAVTSLIGVYALVRSVQISIPADGGILVEGELGSPRFVNPLLAVSDADRDLASLTYAGLMGLGAEGNLIPVLAESYSVSEDGKEYTFVLRNDLVWSDGAPITADDVAFTVGKAQDAALKSPELANWSGVKTEALDARTVRFTLGKPYAPFLANATLGILPAHLWRGISTEDFPFSTLATEPVGAGPFIFSKIVRGDNGIIREYDLSANPAYALGRPHLDGIRFVFYSQADDLKSAVRGGAVESAYGVPAQGALMAPYASVFGVFFNPNQNAALARLEVRKALSLAIDREYLTKQVLGGYAAPIMGPVPPGSGINGTTVPALADRISTAAGTLTAAGWAYDPEARLWTQASAKLTLTMTLKTSNVPELKAVAAAVKADWEKLGVPTDIELYEPGDLSQNVIRPRKYDALLFGMVVGRERDLFAFWDSSQRNDPGLNIALYANKTADQLLESSRQESDPAKRLAALQKIDSAIAADYPAAFTHAPDFLYVVPQKLQGVSLPQISTPADRFAGVAGWYVESQYVWPFLVRQ